MHWIKISHPNKCDEEVKQSFEYRLRFACNAVNEEKVRNEIIASPKKSDVRYDDTVFLSGRSTRQTKLP